MEFANPIIHQQGRNYSVSHGDDSGLFVKFETRPIQDEEASAREGRPIFKDADFIIIHVAGDNLTVRDRPVDLIGSASMPPDNIRFRAQWEAFKAQKEQIPDGTALEQWPMITRSLAMEMKAKHIHTVEALAAVSDHNLVLGWRDWREKAKAWLETAKGGAELSRLLEENKQLKQEIQSLKLRLADMPLEEDAPRRGRKAKEKLDGEDAS